MSHDDFLSLDLVSSLDYVCQVADAASFRICAFIDGLDEFEGSGAELVETIHSLEDRAGFKLCLASRPYPIFERSFSRYASLTVQEFNDESIQMYVQAQWKNNRLGLQAGLPQAFGNKIRDKAGGVFLWARLAIDELLQDLLREVAWCKSLDAVRPQKLVLVLQTQIMQYHLVICHFQTCSPAALTEFYRKHEGPPPGTISTNQCAYSLPNKVYDYANDIGWDNFFPICRGLPEVALHSGIFDGNQVEINRFQELFNQVWTKYLDGKGVAKRYFALITCLFGAGARLGGSHICSLLRHWYRYEDHKDPLRDLINALPGIELAHVADCDLKGHGDTGSTFIQHWVDFADYSKQASEMTEQTFHFLLRCGAQINAISEGEPLINTLLAFDIDRIIYMIDRMNKVIIALRAGTDPKLISKDGNALQTARALSSILKDPPEEHWIRDLHLDIYARKNNFEASKREIAKIEEMLEEYLQKGSLTEAELQAYARFNCRNTLYHVSDPWPELNPYRFFKLDKD